MNDALKAARLLREELMSQANCQMQAPHSMIDGIIADHLKRFASPEKPPSHFSMDTAASEPEPQDTDWEDAIEQCNRIMEMCNEVPERGEDFAYSVQQKVQEISETIEESERVTEAQQIALDNMESGVSRWIE